MPSSAHISEEQGNVKRFAEEHSTKLNWIFLPLPSERHADIMYNPDDDLNAELMHIGAHLYPLVHEKYPELVGKIVGMFLSANSKVNEFTGETSFSNEVSIFVKKLLSNPEFLSEQIEEAVSLLRTQGMVGVENRLKKSTFTVVLGSVKPKLSQLRFRRLYRTRACTPAYWLVYPAVRLSVRARSAPKTWKQYGEERAASFEGVTTRSVLRSEDPYSRQAVHFSSREFATLDPISFEWIPQRTEIVPQVGDLICGTIEEDRSHAPRFSRWFVCSEQFFRCWTLIMYKNHASFQRVQLEKKNPQAYWMSGNRLMTAGHLKWRLSNEAHGVRYTQQEDRKKYWHLRTEPTSVKWIHVYCALVLMLRYHVRPDQTNVPVNRGGPTYPHWHLPKNWIKQFIDHHTGINLPDQ